MKKEFLCCVMVLLLVTSAFCAMDKFKLVTFSIGSYEDHWQRDWSTSKETADALMESFKSNLKSVYPKTAFEYAQYFDAAVTEEVFTGSVPDQYNFVFYKGHGSPNMITMWPKNQYVHSTEKKFGKKTYWALFNSCLVFNNEKSYQDDWFGGIHSILGFSSLSWSYPKYKKKYDCGPFGLGTCSYSVASYYVERDFATNWIKGKQGIFMAHANAVYKWIFQERGIGIEPKIVYRFGYVDGQFFDPWDEKFETAIQKPVFATPGSYTGIGSRWYTWGTPSY